MMNSISHTHLSTTHSTNSQLIDWIILSYQEQSPVTHERPHYSRLHLLTADSQTSGRGQHGRTWQSPIGNVYLSLYIPTNKFADNTVTTLEIALDGRLSLCVGYQLALMPVIQQINEQRLANQLPTVGVKWVNDLGFYQDSLFNKLAGILIEPVLLEGKMLGVVVGVGINVVFAPVLTVKLQENLNYHAVSLADIAVTPLTTKKLKPYYDMVSTAILAGIKQFNGFYQTKNIESFLQDFNQVDVLNNKNIEVRPSTQVNASKIGIARGIDKNGCLQLLDEKQQLCPIWTGTIHMLSNY